MERSSADHFVAAVPGHGHGADLAEPPQAVRLLRAARKLHDFERAAQIYVQAALFRLAIQRRRAMQHRVGRCSTSALVLVAVQAEMRLGQIAAKNADALVQVARETPGNRGAIAALAKAFARPRDGRAARTSRFSGSSWRSRSPAAR